MFGLALTVTGSFLGTYHFRTDPAYSSQPPIEPYDEVYIAQSPSWTLFQPQNIVRTFQVNMV